MTTLTSGTNPVNWTKPNSPQKSFQDTKLNVDQSLNCSRMIPSWKYERFKHFFLNSSCLFCRIKTIWLPMIKSIESTYQICTSIFIPLGHLQLMTEKSKKKRQLCDYLVISNAWKNRKISPRSLPPPIIVSIPWFLAVGNLHNYESIQTFQKHSCNVYSGPIYGEDVG